MCARQNFGIGLLKSYLTFGYLTCSVRSKKMSTLHPNVQYTVMLAVLGTRPRGKVPRGCCDMDIIFRNRRQLLRQCQIVATVVAGAQL